MKHAAAKKPVTLICGLPGVGKSTFCEYLATDRGHFVIVLEENASDATRTRLRELWQDGVARGNAKPFVYEIRHQPGPIAIEWGFPINERCIRYVEAMRALGVRVVWFESDDDVARGRFVGRATVPLAAFEKQVADIRRAYEEIMARLEPVVVDVVSPDGSDRTVEELFDLVFPDTGG